MSVRLHAAVTQYGPPDKKPGYWGRSRYTEVSVECALSLEIVINPACAGIPVSHQVRETVSYQVKHKKQEQALRKACRLRFIRTLRSNIKNPGHTLYWLCRT